MWMKWKMKNKIKYRMKSKRNKNNNTRKITTNNNDHHQKKKEHERNQIYQLFSFFSFLLIFLFSITRVVWKMLIINWVITNVKTKEILFSFGIKESKVKKRKKLSCCSLVFFILYCNKYLINNHLNATTFLFLIFSQHQYHSL